MRFTRKKVSRISFVLSVVFFMLAAAFYSIALQLFQKGVIDRVYALYLLSMTVGTVGAAGCLVCVYVTVQLLRTKILRETYFFIVLVPLFSFLGYIMLNFMLKIDFPLNLSVAISIVLATPLSHVFAGYSKRTLWRKLRSMGLNHGITLLTVIFLLLIPIIEILPSTTFVRSIGVVKYQDIVFEIGNDATKVQGQIAKSVFTAEVPIPSDTTFVAKQAVNVTNQSPASLDLKIYLEDLSGNLSKVRQLKIFFTLGNGSEIFPLSVDNGNLKYKEVSLSMKSQATVAIGVMSSAQNVSSTDIIIMSLLMRIDDHNLGMNISIDSL